VTRRPPKTHKALPASVNAILFAQLAVMEDAGMAAVDAFKTIAQAPTDVGAGAGKEVGERSRRVASTLAKGRALPDAGLAAGIFSIRDVSLIAAGSESGSPARSYRRLAERYERLDTRSRRIRGQCLMPAVVLVLGLAIAPLPDLVLGHMSLGGYIFYLLRAIGFVAGVIVVGRMLWRESQVNLKGAIARTLGFISLKMPLLGPNNVKRNIANYLEEVGILLQAGLTPDRACKLGQSAMSNPFVIDDLAGVPARLKSGTGFSDAHANSQYLSTPVHQIMYTSEVAGRLAEGLARVCALEREQVGAFDDQVAAWVPRVIYGAVLAYLSSGLL
jgi:general secretion pathway protein F